MRLSGVINVKKCFDYGLEAFGGGNNRDACLWLERVTRLCPEDETAALALAAAQQRLDPRRAHATLDRLVHSNPDCMEGWLALAAVHSSANEADRAGRVCAELLTRFSVAADANFRLLANRIVRSTSGPGWIDVGIEGVMTASLTNPKRGPPDVTVDGKAVVWRAMVADGPVLRARLPPWARRGRVLNAAVRGKPLLGNGLDLKRRFSVQGIVDWQADDGDVAWAWIPANSATPPRLAVTADEERPVWLRGAVAGRISPHLLSVPRTAWRFALPASLSAASRLAIQSPDGRDLWGSPFLAGGVTRINQQAAFRIASATTKTPLLAAAFDPWQPLLVEQRQPRRVSLPKPTPGQSPCCIVIPVLDQLEDAQRCLQSVLAALPSWGQVIIVDDGSSEPGLADYLAGLARSDRVRVLRNAVPQGFPKAVNIGLRAAMASRRCDVVLLNSDTVVAPGWLKKLRRAAYASADIGSVTPLSCDGSIVSHPAPEQVGDPGAAVVAATDGQLERLNDSKLTDIPSGVGFCMYMTASCLAETGLLREDVFAQGYGEENDWCMRARALGWRHVAALDMFVAHLGGRTFGLGRDYLTRRNAVVLERLHPGYRAFVAHHPYHAALQQTWRRFQADRLRARATTTGRSVLLVSHGHGGGVERFVQSRIVAFAAAGLRVLVLRSVPAQEAPGPETCRLAEGGDQPSGMEYTLPEDAAELAELLAACSIRSVEIHHMLGHGQAMAALVESLAVPVYIYIHDYALWCPRMHLTSYNDVYCGEPDRVEVCDACVRDLGSDVSGCTSVGDYRRHNGDLLRKASGCYVPSMDVKLRLGRQFPDIRTTIVPWEGAMPTRTPPGTPVAATRSFKVVVLGAIGLEKGYRTLLACARDADRRDLPLSFHVVGFTIDDERLMETGRVFVSGRYGQDEAADLLEQVGADLGFVPSVCPETWCFTLSELLASGLPVVTFDIGTQAERTGQLHNGLVLSRILPPHAINDEMLRHIRRQAAYAATPQPEAVR